MRRLPQLRVPHAKILLVDDSAVVREITRDLLIEEGYRVLEGKSAEDSVRILRKEGPAIGLSITDVCMPRTSGIQLAKQVSNRYPTIPILFISGLSEEAPTEFPPTVSHFLSKPFTRMEQARAVNAALRPNLKALTG